MVVIPGADDAVASEISLSCSIGGGVGVRRERVDKSSMLVERFRFRKIGASISSQGGSVGRSA